MRLMSKSVSDFLRKEISKRGYNDSRYNSRKSFERAWYRKDPVPYTGKQRHHHYQGVRSGRIARDVLGTDYKKFGRASLRERFFKEICPYNSFYDTKFRSMLRQPKRDWKRTKVKRQYLRHSKGLNISHKDINKKFLEENPFDAKSLEKDLFDRTVVDAPSYMKDFYLNRFYPEDINMYQDVTPNYEYLREDGDIEYECPKCKMLNMTDFNNSPDYANVEYCKVCGTYIKLSK